MHQIAMKKRVLEILNELELNANDVKSAGLHTGLAGVALFFLYSYKAELIAKERVEPILEKLLDKIRNDELPYSLADGLVGVGFVIQEYIKEGLLDEDYSNFLDYLDEVINPITISMFKKCKYDYLHCGLGAIDFLLTRPNPGNDQIIKESVNLLVNFAEKDDFGTFWSNSIDRIKGIDEIQRPLGAAHGQTSIIHLLTKLYEAKFIEDKELIRTSIHWVMSQQNYDFNQNSIFPPRLINDDFSVLGSRLGWCTGDLGILFPIYFASQKMGFNDFKKRALDMLLHTCSMRDLEKCVVIDNGVCHGVAGIAHMYNRLYKDTGIELFNETYQYWMNILLEKRKQLEDQLPDPFDMNAGITGIGLTLLAGLGFETNWDRFFVLS